MKSPAIIAMLMLVAGPVSTSAAQTSSELFFAFDSATLRGDTADDLAPLVTWAQQNPEGTIVLEGHADPIGPADYNVGLSARRAEAVRGQLEQMGVAPDRIVLSMYGEDGKQRPSLAQNRRVTAYGTQAPLYEIVDRTLAQNATALVWEEPVTLAELEGPEHPAVIATR